ncbi:MAG: YdcF family protein [Candidatus Hydrogenedens sp.]|nr:YdcF family protein [Candidatus Hydrogenedens sp.]
MRKNNLVLRKILLAIAIPILVYALAMLAIVVAGMRDDTAKADAAVVLGNRIEADGQPSDRLRARLDRALELYESGMVPLVIVSGGIGLEGFDEATVMRAYLMDHGIPADRVIADSEGVNTWSTARNAARILRERDLHSAYAVSQYFHVPRTRLAFRRFGIETVYGAHPRYFEWRDVYSTFREVAAYAVYSFRPLPDPAGPAV